MNANTDSGSQYAVFYLNSSDLSIERDNFWEDFDRSTELVQGALFLQKVRASLSWMGGLGASLFVLTGVEVMLRDMTLIWSPGYVPGAILILASALGMKLINENNINKLVKLSGKFLSAWLLSATVVLATCFYGALKFSIEQEYAMAIAMHIAWLCLCAHFINFFRDKRAWVCWGFFHVLAFLLFVLVHVPDAGQIISGLSLLFSFVLLTFMFSEKWGNEVHQDLSRMQKALISNGEQNKLLHSNIGNQRRLISSLGHDLIQPINSIRLFANALKMRTVDHRAQGFIHNVTHCAEYLNCHVNAMLNVTKVDCSELTVNLEVVCIDSIFQRISLNFLDLAKKKEISLKFYGGKCLIYSDFLLLERIISNLVQNAIKYTDKGRVIVAARLRGPSVHVEVWDTGIGIAAQDLPSVFDEFYQVNKSASVQEAGGVGMGLATVKRLVSALNVSMEIKSVVRRGSVFRIVLPKAMSDH